MNKEKPNVTETRYTPDIAAVILKRVAEGEPLRQVYRDRGMPAESSVREWARTNREGFGAAYQQARSMQVEVWADEIVEIAYRDDLDANDKRVRIDTLKWLCSKLMPKRYGDRLLVAGESENPVRILHEHVSLDSLSTDQLDALDAFAQSLVEQRQGDGAVHVGRLLAHQHRRGTP
jgi:hypothetical protein